MSEEVKSLLSEKVICSYTYLKLDPTNGTSILDEHTKDGLQFLSVAAHNPILSNMRNRDPHRENVENILAISLPIVTMQHIRESLSASHSMRKSASNAGYSSTHRICRTRFRHSCGENRLKRI